MRKAFYLCFLSVVALGLGGADRSKTFSTRGTCDGYRAVSVGMVPNMCMGLVWQGDDGPRMPRDLLPLSDTRWLVTDLGGWERSKGAVWQMDIAADRSVRWRKLVSNLSMPHTIDRGPDGRIYISEMNRILALDADAADPERSLTTVVGDLPDNRLHDNRHPLSSFVFDTNGDLLVNVGAPSDRCLDGSGRPRTSAKGRCAEEADTAQVRRHAYLGQGRWSAESTVFASGLRNSIALVRHRSGTILQAENSVDLEDPNNPFEEVNVLRQGGHYGWPYCVNMQTPLPGWSAAQARCGQRDRPVALMPPHAAPLDLMYYSGAMFPELEGRLLVTWHGYRRTAGRIMAIETNEQGVPLTDINGYYAIYPRGALRYPANTPSVRGRIITPGWDRVAGQHPRGTPVAMAVAGDGSIWVTDDKSRAILRIARP
ncbi:PQQ-dependent sugar dehydrogenase [uncultured Brevundimonas sp.]|uniref:PQQ-dependent sugar dehydrogenase n=1 Tax=uncultured Brevundimonas sp. TaxID=213418 RepID=UPI00260686A8|nr:PQQ-dependent sugar dehydrogenase [uncultured Brevundimonas sp.]